MGQLPGGERGGCCLLRGLHVRLSACRLRLWCSNIGVPSFEEDTQSRFELADAAVNLCIRSGRCLLFSYSCPPSEKPVPAMNLPRCTAITLGDLNYDVVEVVLDELEWLYSRNETSVPPLKALASVNRRFGNQVRSNKTLQESPFIAHHRFALLGPRVVPEEVETPADPPHGQAPHHRLQAWARLAEIVLECNRSGTQV